MRSNVAVGDTVSAGDVIGRSDSTGLSSGPHLHFELRKGVQPIDPAPLLVKTVAELGGGSVHPVEPNDVGVEPAVFPVLPRARIVVGTLNIRSGPGVENRIAGTLVMDDKVDVLRKIPKENNIWLQIGYQQYVAMQYEGSILARWI
jgi:Peptidase family M23/Bacterial SH3 domain